MFHVFECYWQVVNTRSPNYITNRWEPCVLSSMYAPTYSYTLIYDWQECSLAALGETSSSVFTIIIRNFKLCKSILWRSKSLKEIILKKSQVWCTCRSIRRHPLCQANVRTAKNADENLMKEKGSFISFWCFHLIWGLLSLSLDSMWKFIPVNKRKIVQNVRTYLNLASQFSLSQLGPIRIC